MNFLKWVYSGIVVSVVIVLIGVLGQGKLSVSQATADDAERPVHADIVKVEQTFSLVEFDLSKKAHLLRKTRLDFYIAQAKQADLRGWKFKRDEFVERAENILSHHLTQNANDVIRNTEPYTAHAI
ncbi:hypothetical protein [Alteromonas sp. KUL106]|uniref:hypothetical protein n=1 Tax=Alteromonas sp. KUL106 TaxID=2480799 RepID=UPI0012E64AEE|nr:hypothetical protein [Alteromonas sp. KUL106]GFD67816.1 hypothetical protein KUL106_10790 [Alteromonas sp. KUL106]GFD82437.1 hypothetical protein KUL118_52990 [Tenacibaculum sp. KUL118]